MPCLEDILFLSVALLGILMLITFSHKLHSKPLATLWLNNLTHVHAHPCPEASRANLII